MAMDAAELLGLSSCMIGHFVHREKEVSELLNIKGDMRLALGLIVGYAKNKTPPKVKINRCYDEKYNIDLVKLSK
jgi:nitroreductase